MKKLVLGKCKDLICKINKVRTQLHDVDIVQMKNSYKDLERFILKIYSRQKKVARRENQSFSGESLGQCFIDSKNSLTSVLAVHDCYHHENLNLM